MTQPPERFYAGAVFGQLTIRQKVRENPHHPSQTRRRWRVQCSCGSPPFTVPEMYLLRQPNPKVDCGCSRKTDKTIYNQEYRIWLMMLKRTTDPEHVSYKHYGERGIKVCEEWANPNTGFSAFLAHIGPRPSANHTVERINNNQGYQPTFEGKLQVKWALPDEQAANRRPKQS